MTNTGQLTHGTSNEDDKFEEEWKVVLTNKAEYPISKMQAMVLKQAIASGNRSTVMFESFAIPIPYIIEFYRVRRYLKGQHALPAKATEAEYVPIPPEKWEAMKKTMYAKIGRKI